MLEEQGTMRKELEALRTENARLKAELATVSPVKGTSGS